MRKIHCCWVLLGLVCCSSISHAGAIQEKTDRFTGVRTIGWSTLPSKAEDFAMITSAYTSKNGYTEYRVQLFTYAPSSRFSDCNQTFWLVDGVQAFLAAKYSSVPANGYTIERFTFSPNRKILDTLAAAKRIEYKVCDVEGEVSNEDLDGLRKVATATKK